MNLQWRQGLQYGTMELFDLDKSVNFPVGREEICQGYVSTFLKDGCCKESTVVYRTRILDSYGVWNDDVVVKARRQTEDMYKNIQDTIERNRNRKSIFG